MTAPARAIGKYERLCFERHERDLALTQQQGGHPKGFRFVPALGDRVVAFIENFCKHHKGEWAGKPLILEEWQRRILRILFGWIRPDADRPGQWVRRFRTAYIEIARKNGKSLLASGLGLYLMVGDQEPGAEVYSFATKEDQARLLWIEAGKTVNKSERLKKHVKVLADSITFDGAGAFFKPLGSDSETQDGLNPSAGIADELHAHKTRGIQSGMGSRREPMMIAITTAGVFRPESIGWEKHDYAQKVLDGLFEDDAFFAFIAAPDAADDPFSELAQQKANPNWGISVKPAWLRERAEEARALPSALNEYLRKNLNIWSQQSTAWLSLEQWKECDPSPVPRAEFEAALEGRTCRAGLDLSSKLDLTALVLEFETERGHELICRFWLPEDRAAAEAAKGRTHYAQWAREGWLAVTPGNAIDYDFIKAELATLAKRYRITELAFDPWGSQKLVNDLVKEGIAVLEADGEKPVCVECGQGFKSLSEPTKDFEVSVVKGKLKHNGNPVLRWCANNVVVVNDEAGNLKPNKAKAAGKIDGIVAAIMARSRSIVAPEEEVAQGGFSLL
jgi:phage terminase large subunit-like protein